MQTTTMTCPGSASAQLHERPLSRVRVPDGPGCEAGPSTPGPSPQALAFQPAWEQHISPKLTELFKRLATEPEAVNLALAQVGAFRDAASICAWRTPCLRTGWLIRAFLGPRRHGRTSRF